MRPIRDTLSDLRQTLLQSVVRAPAVEPVRIEQLNRLITLSHIFIVAGVNTLFLMMLTYRDNSNERFCLVTSALIVCAYVVVAARAPNWRVKSKLGLHTERCIRECNAIYVLLGVLWAILLIGLMPDVNAGERSLLYGIITGLISTAALSVPLSLTVSFGLPVAIGGLGAIISADSPLLLPTTGCLAGYIVLAFACAVYLNREFISRIEQKVRLEEQKVKLQEQTGVIGLLLRDFVENSSDWLWETDGELRLAQVSDRMAQVVEMPVERLSGSPLPALLDKIANDDGGERASALMQCLSSRTSFRDMIIPVQVAGETRWWSMTGKPHFNEHGTFIGYHGIGSDVTAARRSTEQISYLAHHDSLTSLPNRVLFTDTLTRSCAQGGAGTLALLCLDLDGFKAVNDTMGHAVGDALLVAVADRLRRCIREGDVVARLGGDEFAVIMADATPDDAAQLASRIVERIGRPYSLDGQPIEVGVSIGVVLAQPEGDEPSKLLQNADLALYRAKADGRRTWRFYDAAMDEQVQDRQRLLADLRGALGRGELGLKFQPIIGLTSGRVVAVETLLRWMHPTRGPVPAPEFVQLAEEGNLISSIGAWVINQAVMEAASWPSSVVVAVNLSPLQFRQADLVTMISDTLKLHNFPASRLELEITESILLTPTEQTVGALRRLRELGVRVALDDFGTGYSSLSYLRRFPFDTIKIDRSFVSDLGHDKAASAILKAIIEIARSVRMTVTAEGVETEEQAAILRAYGCDRAQGFLFSRPVSAPDVDLYITHASERSSRPAIAKRADVGAALA